MKRTQVSGSLLVSLLEGLVRAQERSQSVLTLSFCSCFSQHGILSQQFLDLINKCNSSQSEYRDRNMERIKRQLQISKCHALLPAYLSTLSLKMAVFRAPQVISVQGSLCCCYSPCPRCHGDLPVVGQAEKLWLAQSRLVCLEPLKSKIKYTTLLLWA